MRSARQTRPDGSVRLCVGTMTTVIIVASVGAGSVRSMVLGILWGFFTTVSLASEGSRSLMGGSDVTHCVRLSLTGVTKAAV